MEREAAPRREGGSPKDELQPARDFCAPGSGKTIRCGRATSGRSLRCRRTRASERSTPSEVDLDVAGKPIGERHQSHGQDGARARPFHREAEGNISRGARELGLGRTQEAELDPELEAPRT
jgi:hypothetical protein